jgi:hypothetical protein
MKHSGHGLCTRTPWASSGWRIHRQGLGWPPWTTDSGEQLRSSNRAADRFPSPLKKRLAVRRGGSIAKVYQQVRAQRKLDGLGQVVSAQDAP